VRLFLWALLGYANGFVTIDAGGEEANTLAPEPCISVEVLVPVPVPGLLALALPIPIPIPIPIPTLGFDAAAAPNITVLLGSVDSGGKWFDLSILIVVALDIYWSEPEVGSWGNGDGIR